MYNQNAALRQGTFVSTFHDEFVQYAVDKVGFNVRTLHGVDTCFSDVGLIAVVTPGIKRDKKSLREKEILPREPRQLNMKTEY